MAAIREIGGGELARLAAVRNAVVAVPRVEPTEVLVPLLVEVFSHRSEPDFVTVWGRIDDRGGA